MYCTMIKSVATVFIFFLAFTDARVLRTKRQVGRFPALQKPAVITPVAGNPCPVVLANKRFGGGAAFGAPVGFGWNVAGQNQNDGPWGHAFDTAWGEQVGGSIFGDSGVEQLDYDCEYPTGNNGQSVQSQDQKAVPLTPNTLTNNNQSNDPKSKSGVSNAMSDSGSARYKNDPIAKARLGNQDIFSRFQNRNHPGPIDLQRAYLSSSSLP